MFLTAIDIGSSAIKVLVAETTKDNKLSLVEAFKAPSAGVRKGEIVSGEETTQALVRIFGDLRNIHKGTTKNVLVSIGGKNVHINHSRGIVAVSRADNEIYQDDIDRAIRASQAISLPSNRKIIHTLIIEYIVDGVGEIRNPLGMNGSRLEVDSVIIDAFGPVYSELRRSVETAGARNAEIVFSPFAASEAALTKTHKELGAVLIDIGAQTTGMCVFEEDAMVSAKVFPVGSTNITNDLAIALKSSIDVSEKIKIEHGDAFSREVSSKDKVNLKDYDENLKAQVSKKFISEVIEVRLDEIFELVHNELKSAGKTQLPAGVVLCGGGVKMPGIIDLARQQLKLPVHMASCDSAISDAHSSSLLSVMEDPEFTVACGLLRYANNQMDVRHSGSTVWENLKNLTSSVIRNLTP